MPYNPMLPNGMMPGGVARPQGGLPMQAPQLNPMMGAGAMQRPMMPAQGQMMQRPMMPQGNFGQAPMQRPMQPQMNMQQMALRALVQQHSADAMRQQALARAAMGQMGRPQGQMQRPMMPQMQRPMMPQGMPQGQMPMQRPTIPLGLPQRPVAPNPLLGVNPQLQSRLRSVLGV